MEERKGRVGWGRKRKGNWAERGGERGKGKEGKGYTQIFTWMAEGCHCIGKPPTEMMASLLVHSLMNTFA